MRRLLFFSILLFVACAKNNATEPQDDPTGLLTILKIYNEQLEQAGQDAFGLSPSRLSNSDFENGQPHQKRLPDKFNFSYSIQDGKLFKIEITMPPASDNYIATVGQAIMQSLIVACSEVPLEQAKIAMFRIVQNVGENFTDNNSNWYTITEAQDHWSFLIAINADTSALVNSQSLFEAPQPLTEDAAISIELEIAKNNGVIVSAKTNLPPESHMNISLYDSKAILNFGSAQAEVNAEGIAQFEALRDNNTLGNGKYLLEITTPFPSVQSESVQKIIGDKGQYLTGPLVDESDIFPGQRTLKFQQIIAISDSPYTPLDQVVQNHLQAIETYRRQFIDLYTKLMEFKSSPKFHEFGFSPASPYYRWNQDENSLRDKYSGTIMNYTGLYSSDLWHMAIEYKDSGGKETDFTREKNKKIREQLALPLN